MPHLTLSPGQQSALDRCLAVTARREPAFVFVTGKAGTGKSVCLRELRDRRRCVVVAPTGLAATNVEGSTIHRTFGLPIGPMSRGRAKAARYPEVFERCQAIVIDEISMVRADLLDGMDAVLQKTLRNDLPFGGVPVIAFGDMWQLEPVVGKGDEAEWIAAKYRSPFWFDAHVFRHSPQATLESDEAPARVAVETHELTGVFRQSDQEFIDALNLVRVGDPRGLAYINARAHAEPPTGNDEPVSLTFKNLNADVANAARLASLPSERRAFKASIQGDFKPGDAPVAEELELAVGAQVMVARNMETDEGAVVNGDLGVVVGFMPAGAPIVRLRDGRVTTIGRAVWQKMSYTFDVARDDIVESVGATFEQIPLKLAWAITTHKSQGQTLDGAILELERQAFSHGQLYVALSRVRSMDGLYLRRRLTPRDLVVNSRVVEFARPAPMPRNLGAFA